MPSMSAAGFERVNATQRKFRSFRAVNSLSSTITTSGKPRIGSSGPKAWQKRATSLASVAEGWSLDRQDARQDQAGVAESVGEANVRRASRRAATARGDRRPRSRPWTPDSARAPSSRGCRSSSGSGSGGRSSSRRARAGARRTPGCRGCRGPGRPHGRRCSKYFASES